MSDEFRKPFLEERMEIQEEKLMEMQNGLQKAEEEIGKHDSDAPVREHILQFFAYEHLPPHLQAISKPFCDLAHDIVYGSISGDGETNSNPPLPRNPERTVALRKLLEAKDAAVRAVLAK